MGSSASERSCEGALVTHLVVSLNHLDVRQGIRAVGLLVLLLPHMGHLPFSWTLSESASSQHTLEISAIPNGPTTHSCIPHTTR